MYCKWQLCETARYKWLLSIFWCVGLARDCNSKHRLHGQLVMSPTKSCWIFRIMNVKVGLETTKYFHSTNLADIHYLLYGFVPRCPMSSSPSSFLWLWAEAGSRSQLFWHARGEREWGSDSHLAPCSLLLPKMGKMPRGGEKLATR